ncbi:MAG: hypothetical protein GF383_14345 [Candidatus Lokiarchaeota archaeon]|nr:hypothetical protein [Candidatus Lokiarchaeota archaeon]
MPISVSKYLPRHKGTTKVIGFDERPICKYCANPIKIVSSMVVGPIVGLTENYDVQKYYYKCGRALCKGGDLKPLRAKNTIYPPKSDYDYEVHAKVAEYRWKQKLTYEEIIKKMKKDFGIILNLATVERMLKTYEVGCSQKYKPEFKQKIKANGGVLLTIDGMQPLKGNSPLYTVRDEFTGLKIHAKRLNSESTKQIKEVLLEAKQRIKGELKSSVIGIMSDAHPKQRKAISEVFPGVHHCLCHYHFYKYVFKAPKELDSNLMTQTRKFLRNLYYLNKEKIYDNQGKHWKPAHPFTSDLINTLRALSNWKRRPRDPIFVGAELFSRLMDVLELLEEIVLKMNAIGTPFEDEKVIRGLYLKIKDYINTHQDKKQELDAIKSYVVDIKDILDNDKASADTALSLLEDYCKELVLRLHGNDCGVIEAQFIEELEKYVETKGALLFNYKRIKGAPKTNNLHELSFKQLKHFLRKIIGFRTAKSFLLSHGEHIIFVNPGETFEGILSILKNTDFSKVRELIRLERTSRDHIRFVVHDLERWNLKLKDLKQNAKNLLEWIITKN